MISDELCTENIVFDAIYSCCTCTVEYTRTGTVAALTVTRQNGPTTN